MDINNKDLDTKYIKFFDNLNVFISEQKKQKKRGLNDYNILNVVRKENAEVGMHSNVIYSLINPNGLHYQEDLFLNIFIKEVIEIPSDFGKVISVNAEELTSTNRRIDFTIKSTNYYIGIEMKIDASDLNEQIYHYYHDLKKKASEDNNQNVIIYYLTKDGKEASEYSSKGIKYNKISFEKHILNWIYSCQHEIRNITNLNEAFENYKQIVKKISNIYKGNILPINDLLKEKENFKIATEIYKVYSKTTAELETSFWLSLINKIKEHNIYELMENYNINVQDIEKARNSSSNGSSSQVDIQFLLHKFDSNTKIILQVGSSNWNEGIYGSIAKINNGKWVNNNHEESILNILSEIDYLNFAKPSWAYGLTTLNNSIQLRNEKLIDAHDKINELALFIQKLINDIKKSIKDEDVR